VSNSATGVHLHSHFIKGATIRCDRVQLQEWLANIQQNVSCRAHDLRHIALLQLCEHCVLKVRTVREIDATFYPAFWKLYHNQGSGGSKFALEGGGGAGQVLCLYPSHPLLCPKIDFQHCLVPKMPARREKTAAEKERERFF